jgi:hypothetical protein
MPRSVANKKEDSLPCRTTIKKKMTAHAALQRRKDDSSCTVDKRTGDSYDL